MTIFSYEHIHFSVFHNLDDEQKKKKQEKTYTFSHESGFFFLGQFYILLYWRGPVFIYDSGHRFFSRLQQQYLVSRNDVGVTHR